MNWYSLPLYFRFYAQAVTKYQLHSPAIFALVMATMEDSRRYYAFEDIPEMRKALLQSPHDSGDQEKQKIRNSIRKYAPARREGERLFRLVQHFAPKRILMLGSGASLGCLYAALSGQSDLEIMEAEREFEPLTRLNLEYLKLKQQVVFLQKNQEWTSSIAETDLVICYPDYQFNDEKVLDRLFSFTPKAWVFMDMYSSPERFQLLSHLMRLPAVRASVDFFYFTVLLPANGIREVQHLKVVPAWQKPWKFY
ncbi:MAG: hypothetical protein IT261_14380 [Saprospiraceae bacterium]|nr:hypothetical protein [Saprospiraceae bacterium]